MWAKYYQFLGQIKESLRDFFSLWSVRFYVLFLFLLNGLLWFVAFRAIAASGQELVILHYNVNFGVNLVGGAKKILIIPLLGLLVIIINFFVIFLIRQLPIFLRHLLLAGALMVNFLLLASLLAIYFVNFHSLI